MDYYLNNTHSYNRLKEEYFKYKSLTIAFDFDDTVYDFHKKGREYNHVILLLRELKAIGCYLICWTGQQNLAFVENQLNEYKIPFDTINDNPPYYKSNSRKIDANAYLDDRAGLKQVYNQLSKLINELKQ